MIDDASCFGDGSVDVGIFSDLTHMILPRSSLIDDEGSDYMVGIAFSGQCKGIGEVGFGFTTLLLIP